MKRKPIFGAALAYLILGAAPIAVTSTTWYVDGVFTGWTSSLLMAKTPTPSKLSKQAVAEALSSLPASGSNAASYTMTITPDHYGITGTVTSSAITILWNGMSFPWNSTQTATLISLCRSAASGCHIRGITWNPGHALFVWYTLSLITPAGPNQQAFPVMRPCYYCVNPYINFFSTFYITASPSTNMSGAAAPLLDSTAAALRAIPPPREENEQGYCADCEANTFSGRILEAGN